MADKGKKENGFYYARTNRQITSGAKWEHYNQREIELIRNAISTYGEEYAPNLYIHEGIKRIGIEDIKAIIKKHIELTGNRPFVVIDYLQIIKPDNERATDKMNTDTAVTTLKGLSREYKIPVLAISSFNRDNYLSAVNMSSFKESGAIEYSSDVLLGLQFKKMDSLQQTDGKRSENLKNIEKWKREIPRQVQLRILKNRNGATGADINYDYYPMFNWFSETAKESEEH